MCNRFLWSGNISKIGGIKISWNQACLPKEEGGLGLRNISIWNKVLNLRLIWMLFNNKDSLWVAWNKAHRFQGTSFWIVSNSHSSSWIWKSLLALRHLAKRFIICEIANGYSTSFWHDSWTNIGPLIAITGPSGPRLLGIPLSATVKEGTNASGWILPSPRTRNPALATIAKALIQTRIPADSYGSDVFSWQVGSTISTAFSSKSTWESLRPANSPQAWSKIVWYKGHVPKLAFTFWVAHHDRLPTKSRMAKWNHDISNICTLCDCDEEARDHLFFSCNFSMQVWTFILAKLGLSSPPFADWDSLILWLSTAGTSNKTLKRLSAQATIYLLWKERNNRVHNSLALTPTRISHQLDRLIRDSILARPRRKNHKNLLSLWFTYE